MSDLTQLGANTPIPASPDQAKLERAPNPQKGALYLVRFAAPEFTSICPVTGQPDFAKIEIQYIADKLCIETKSLKFYLASFRNTRAFNEAIVNRILDDIIAACRPRRAIVSGEFSPRGGIGVHVVAEHPDNSGESGRPRQTRKPRAR